MGIFQSHTYIHIIGWSIVSSQRGVCLWDDAYWVRDISLACLWVLVGYYLVGFVGSQKCC